MNAVGLRTLRISRFERALERHRERLPARVFTDAERAYCAPKRRASQHYAARLAAKLAARSVLSAGRLREIEVVRDALGAPGLLLHGTAAAAGEGRRLHLSLSHDGDLAVALVVAEGC